MATEKILIFDEAGNAKRMKVRIARFLDNEPVTATDKENIRTTLDVDGSQSGDFTTDITTTQKVGIGDTTPAHPLTLTANPGAANTPVAWLHNSGNVSEYDGTVISTVNDGSDVEVLHVRTNTTTYNGGNSLLLVRGDGRIGIGTSSPSAGAVGGKVVHVQTSGETASVRVDRSDASTAGTLSLTAGNSTLGVYGTGSKPIAFSVNGSEVARLDDAGRLGVGQAAMGSYNSNANNLVVGSGSGNEGMSIASGASSEGGIYFANGTTGTDQYNGALLYRHNINRLDIFTNGAARWYVDSTGNLIAAAAGQGIDFSSTSDGSGTMSSELLDDYEEGTWSPAFAMTGGDFTTAPTMDIISARYVKVGHMVTFYAYLRTDSVDITGAGGSLAVEGLPYANAGSNNYAAINVGQANFWTNAPSGGYVYSGGDYIVLTKRNTGITGSMTEMTAADLTAGVTANQNQLMISGSYFSF